MTAALALLSMVGLALVATAGVAAGFRRTHPVAIEPPADPLDDRRSTLVRSLADLEDARSSGALEDADYRRLRGQTEERMARVTRAIDERRLRPVGSSNDGRAGVARASGRVPPWAVATLLAATVGAVLVAGLVRDSEGVASGTSTVAASGDGLGFFEQRVSEHPDDLAARLDLAHRYLDAGRIEDALRQYTVALELDPDDAEALAHVGLILFQAGRPDEALVSVDRALDAAPDYPEAVFIRGVILLNGLDRPAAAIHAFERYLEVAPFGAEREAARSLIDQARASTGTGTR